MTIRSHIKFDGEKWTEGTDGTARLALVVYENAGGLVTAAAARAAGLTGLPTAVALGDLILVRQTVGEPTQTGPNSWIVEATYGIEASNESKEPPTVGTWKLKWNTGRATTKLVTAKELISAQSASAGTYPLKDLKLCIGWDGDQASGVEVQVAEPTFTITKWYAPSVITTGTFKTICAACSPPSTNDGTWLGFAEGEVAFFGAEAEAELPLRHGLNLTQPIPLNLNFGYSPNKTNIVVSPDITVAAKKGWEYLDVRYIKSIDGDSLVPVPMHAHVWRIFDELDFATFFGIA